MSNEDSEGESTKSESRRHPVGTRLQRFSCYGKRVRPA